MKSFVNNKIVVICLHICFAVATAYIAYTFPLNLILDLFWDKVDQKTIEEEVDYYGESAGLPAGDGVTKLTDVDQFYELQMTDYITVEPEYITFETDSIIPLGIYHLNSEMEAHSTSYWSGGHYYSSNRTLPKYTDFGFLGVFYFYNQYYLVKLPDGNYVPTLLDDAYYVKYRLAGKVQLPLGVADRMNREERASLKPYLDEYDLSDDRILVMFCQKRYEDWILLYGGFAFLSFIIILILGIFLKEIIKNKIYKNRQEPI